MASAVVFDPAGFNVDNYWVANSTVSENETLEDQQSSTGEELALPLTQQTVVYSEYTFTVGDLKYTYRGEWTLTIERGLVFGTVSLSGFYDTVEVERAGTPVATYSGQAIPVDFGSRSNIPLAELVLTDVLMLLDDPLD